MKTHFTTTTLRGPTIVFGAVLACCLSLYLPLVLAGPGSWTQKAPMPMPVVAAACCEADGILYVAGGELSFAVPTDTLFAYDPKTDSWTRKKDMLTARSLAVAGAVDGIVYVIGGGNLFASIWRGAVEAYDPKTDTWATKAPMHNARQDMAACTVDGLIYVLGGFIANSQPVALVECYNPKTDQWTQKANLPRECMASVAQVVNGIIYLFDGNNTFAYDPKKDTWETKASMPAGTFESLNTMAGALDGRVYLFGGFVSAGSCASDLTLAYDPGQNKFGIGIRMMPQHCAVAAYATIDGKIYISGGMSGDPRNCAGAVYYDSLLVFDPQGGVTPQFRSLNYESANTVRLVWQGEAGRLYGVQSRPDVANSAWARVNFSPGMNTVLATNDLVEVTCTVSPADTARFFRVFEVP